MKIIYDSAELGECGFVYVKSGEVDFVFIFASKISVDALMTLKSWRSNNLSCYRADFYIAVCTADWVFRSGAFWHETEIDQLQS